MRATTGSPTTRTAGKIDTYIYQNLVISSMIIIIIIKQPRILLFLSPLLALGLINVMDMYL